MKTIESAGNVGLVSDVINREDGSDEILSSPISVPLMAEFSRLSSVAPVEDG